LNIIFKKQTFARKTKPQDFENPEGPEGLKTV